MKAQSRGKIIILIAATTVVFLILVTLQIMTSKPRSKADQTPSLAITPTPEPGLEFDGWVRQEDGEGVAGVSILKAYASYPGDIVATTDPKGYYHTTFFYIPGDEMVRVWAEKPETIFTPTVYDWRHYYGYEHRQLDFTLSIP